jgi:Chaperone of endosialidase
MEVGDMSSGANPQTTQQQQTSNSSQNTTSTSAPNPFVQPFLQRGVQDLVDYYNANPTAPGYYPNSTIAPASAASQAAQGALMTRGAEGSVFMPAANNLVEDTLTGKYLDINNNPYFQRALAAGFAPQTENFNNSILPNLRSQFEGSGRNLGGADMATAQTAAKNLDQTQANASATAANNAYGMERGLQSTALGMLPALQNMDYQNIAAMAQAGASTDAANQAAIDAAVGRYNANAMAQPNYISDFLARIGAGYPGGQTTGTGTSTSSGTSYGTVTPASNPTASGIGAGLGALGTIAQFLPFIPGIGPSDVRLKKNVRGPIGRTNSGHNLYSYEWLGSDKPEIGLLAQEVERTDPDAVVTHPSGYKMVNYSRALAAPGGLM